VSLSEDDLYFLQMLNMLFSLPAEMFKDDYDLEPIPEPVNKFLYSATRYQPHTMLVDILHLLRTTRGPQPRPKQKNEPHDLDTLFKLYGTKKRK